METDLFDNGGSGGNTSERDGGQGAWPGERVYSSSVSVQADDMLYHDTQHQAAHDDPGSRKGFLALKDHNANGLFFYHPPALVCTHRAPLRRINAPSDAIFPLFLGQRV